MTDAPAPQGDDLIAVLAALSHPQRIRILGTLAGGRDYVSRLARVLEMSRPLLHMHLQRLEAAHLVTGHLEIGADGKTVKYFQINPFAIHLTPASIAAAAALLTATKENPS